MNDQLMETTEDYNGGIPFVPEKGFYQPSTDESWEAYQALISIVEDRLGGFPRHVLCGAADEVLSVLKSEIISESMAKKFEIEKLLGPISVDSFNQFVMISDIINDYNNPQNQNDFEGFPYIPTTEENWRNYNLFLDVIAQIIGDDQPEIVLRLTADGVLTILKNDEIETDGYRKEDIEYNLGPITYAKFDHLKFMAGLITDFNDPQPLDRHPSSMTTDLLMGPTTTSASPNFFLEEEEKKDGSSLRLDDDEEMVGPEFDQTVNNDGEIDDDHDDADYDGVDDEFKKMVITDKTEEEDEDWVVVAFDSWNGFNGDDDVGMG